MNNNYSKTNNFYLNIMMEMEKRRKEDSSDLSDSEFSDDFDHRLDEEFNEMLKTFKKVEVEEIDANENEMVNRVDAVTRATRPTLFEFIKATYEALCTAVCSIQ